MSSVSKSTWSWNVEPNDFRRADQLLNWAFAERKGAWLGPSVELSRSQLLRLAKDGKILENGTSVLKMGRPVKEGSVVSLEYETRPEIKLAPKNLGIEVLYQDDELAVIDKPRGLVTHPSAGHEDKSLVHGLLHCLDNLSDVGGVHRPGIVHRLDQYTSGVMVVSKTNRAHVSLSKDFSEHSIRREYIALCYGVPKWESTRLETLIGRNPKDRMRMSAKVRDGRKAITNFALEDTYGNYASQVRASLETGRTHQVRVHLTLLGHSLFGDHLYGKPTSNQAKWKNLPVGLRARISGLDGPALHAELLEFRHPTSQKEMRFSSQMPPVLQKLISDCTELS